MEIENLVTENSSAIKQFHFHIQMETNETVLVSEHNAFSRTARPQCKVVDV